MIIMFKYKDKKEFLSLNTNKRIYYLARLYISRDRKKSSMKYQSRLFSCIGYLRKQDSHTLSVMYNYLTDLTDGHQGDMIWDILPKSILYDQKLRREMSSKQVYKDFNKSMLDDVLRDGE